MKTKEEIVKKLKRLYGENFTLHEEGYVLNKKMRTLVSLEKRPDGFADFDVCHKCTKEEPALSITFIDLEGMRHDRVIYGEDLPDFLISIDKGGTVINTTRHPINIVDENGQTIKTYEPSGQVIRLKSTTKPKYFIDDTPISKTTYEDGDIPEEYAGVIYIVSQLIKKAYPDRDDFVVPAEVIRSEEGHIIGCQSLGI